MIELEKISIYDIGRRITTDTGRTGILVSWDSSNCYVRFRESGSAVIFDPKRCSFDVPDEVQKRAAMLNAYIERAQSAIEFRAKSRSGPANEITDAEKWIIGLVEELAGESVNGQG